MTTKAYKAKWIFFDNEVHENRCLVVENGVIKGLNKEKDIKNLDITDFGNSAIYPGFINTHTHLPMGFFRGLADDLPLMDWLQKHIWPAETKWLSDEFVHYATLLAACEMIRSGTVCASDMYFYSESIAKALYSSGLKGVIGVGVLDFPTKFADNSDEYIKKASELYLKFQENELIKISLCPHAPYTVSPETYRKCVEFSVKHDVLIHTHLSETAWEVEEIKTKYGKTPALLFDEIGLFDSKATFAHCVHLSDEEIEIMGKKNVNISHCLDSNLKLASGFAPIKKMYDAGVNVSIGTDGAASNNDLDMLAETSIVAKLHKAISHDPTFMDAKSALNCATKNGAKALYLDKCGELKDGNFADFIVVSYDAVHMTPVYNPISHLIYSADKSDITHTYVNGKCLMENRKILTIDEEEVKNKAHYWAEKIKKADKK